MPANPAPPADAELDARGLLCPLPLVLATKRLRDEPAGFVLAVVADDPAAPGDFGQAAARGAFELVATESRGAAGAGAGAVRIVIRKPGAQQLPPAA